MKRHGATWSDMQQDQEVALERKFRVQQAESRPAATVNTKMCTTFYWSFDKSFDKSHQNSLLHFVTLVELPNISRLNGGGFG